LNKEQAADQDLVMPHSSFVNNMPGKQFKPRESLESALIIISRKCMSGQSQLQFASPARHYRNGHFASLFNIALV
jgi:hypothetical protein